MTLSLFYHPIVGGRQQPLKWSLLHFPKKGTSRNARSKGLTNRVSLHRWEGIFEVQTHQEKAPRCWKFPEFVNFTWNKKFTFKSTIIYRWSTHVSCEVLYHTINSVDVLDVNDFIPKELSDFFPMYFFVRKNIKKPVGVVFHFILSTKTSIFVVSTLPMKASMDPRWFFQLGPPTLSARILVFFRMQGSKDAKSFTENGPFLTSKTQMDEVPGIYGTFWWIRG